MEDRIQEPEQEAHAQVAADRCATGGGLDARDMRMSSFLRKRVPGRRYKVLYGGRCGGKEAAASRAIEDAILDSKRVVCLSESVALLEKVGVSGLCYVAMDSLSIEDLRHIEAADIVWFREAQLASRRSLDIVYYAVRRPGAEIWLTLNPRYRNDPVWKYFWSPGNYRDEALLLRANWYSNPALPKGCDEERLRILLDNPDHYAHVWLGEPQYAAE